MSRVNFKLNTNSYEQARSERVDWLDSFAESYGKRTAVEVARERNNTSIHEQISAIVNNSTHATVESKVKDMQERIGLTEYIKRFANIESPFDKFGPKMKNDIDNFIINTIASNRGHVMLPAVQDDLLSTFKHYGLEPEDVYNNYAARYINDEIIRQQELNPSYDSSTNLGKVDPTDTNYNDNADFFKGLMPNT